MLISLLAVILIPVITDAEDLNPELVSLLPDTTLSTLSQSDIKCFNWYWTEKEDYDGAQRELFQCPEKECDITTHKDRFCCHRYGVFSQLMNDLYVTSDNPECSQIDDNQTVQPKTKVIKGLKDIVSKYEEECRPEYLAYGDGCAKVAQELGTIYSYHTPFNNVTDSSPVDVQSIATNSTSVSIMNETKTSSPSTPNSMTSKNITLDERSGTDPSSSSSWIIFLVIICFLALIVFLVGLTLYYFKLKKTEPEPSDGLTSIHTLAEGGRRKTIKSNIPSKIDDTTMRSKL